MDSEQERRVAANEARFRAANEAATAAVDVFRGDGGDRNVEVMCECALDECNEMLSISSDEYRHVRSHARWFVVRPDHVVAQVESLVEDHGDWWIIEKDPGPGAAVAEQEA